MPRPFRQPPRYDTRRDRRKITALVLALGLVVIAISEASKPRHWEWLTGPARPGAATGDRGADDARPPGLSDNEPLAPGAFRLVPGVRPSKRNAGAAETVEARKRVSAVALPDDLRIPRELLETIQDESLGIRSAEREAYFSFLNAARAAPLDSLERGGTRDLSYNELSNDPERHRGTLVTLTGELRRFTPLAVGENDAGFGILFDGWLFTDEAGRKNPYRIICTGKPENMPEGEQIRERVDFTGFFFKRCNYETSRGLYSAPLLIGKTVRWIPLKARTDDDRSVSTYIVLALGALVCALVGALWRFSARVRRLRAASAPGIREPSRDELASLERVEATDVGAFLRELSDEGEKSKPGES